MDNDSPGRLDWLGSICDLPLEANRIVNAIENYSLKLGTHPQHL